MCVQGLSVTTATGIDLIYITYELQLQPYTQYRTLNYNYTNLASFASTIYNISNALPNSAIAKTEFRVHPKQQQIQIIQPRRFTNQG